MIILKLINCDASVASLMIVTASLAPIMIFETVHQRLKVLYG